MQNPRYGTIPTKAESAIAAAARDTTCGPQDGNQQPTSSQSVINRVTDLEGAVRVLQKSHRRTNWLVVGMGLLSIVVKAILDFYLLSHKPG